MYLPAHFEETRPQVLQKLIGAHPLGTLVTVTGDGPEADHIPFLLQSASDAPGVLQGHVARANPLWRTQADGSRVLVVFQGPEAYISPDWYPSKREHGKAVPTWNYAVVHAHGRISFIHDREWLLDLVIRLTDSRESRRVHRWQVSDAPAEYVDAMLRAIVGVEVRIDRLRGKWKVSQNRPVSDRQGVVRGLTAEHVPGPDPMAGLVPVGS